LERRIPKPLTAAPDAMRFGTVVRAVMRAGREPLRVDPGAEEATVEVRDPTDLSKEVQRWRLFRGSWARVG
jgi:hypothetical protein